MKIIACNRGSRWRRPGFRETVAVGPARIFGVGPLPIINIVTFLLRGQGLVSSFEALYGLSYELRIARVTGGFGGGDEGNSGLAVVKFGLGGGLEELICLEGGFLGDFGGSHLCLNFEMIVGLLVAFFVDRHLSFDVDLDFGRVNLGEAGRGEKGETFFVFGVAVVDLNVVDLGGGRFLEGADTRNSCGTEEGVNIFLRVVLKGGNSGPT
jgi:hypothetical protein